MNQDPYRPLFGLGLICAIVGVSLWLLYAMNWLGYPRVEHGQIMLSGFFVSFVSGFLMTALPRMSGTEFAKRMEVACAMAFVSLSVIGALAGHLAISLTFTVLQIIFLLLFAARRIVRRQKNPPSGFVFVPVGLLWALVASGLGALIYSGVELPTWAYALSRVGLQQAFLLNLIVGLGSRLIPFLTRAQKLDPTSQQAEAYTWPLIFMALLNASLIGEVISTWPYIYLFRSLILLGCAYALFGLFRRPEESTVLGKGIRASVWCMILGYALRAFLPSMDLAALHLVFIGGYALLTLMIGTRVVLAHGGQSLEPEKNSRSLAMVAGLLLLTAGLRAHGDLRLAAVLWIVAVGLWGAVFGRHLAPHKSSILKGP